ncbi:ribulokinase [Capsulimonas corticalis]|uniref:Ribulokinase n=1 Tax=Capsulimonas corticalis TaxID=2219043 RepID=A0A402D3C3_9BACT|nr:ribulokinase [Capsulimonas corticalis]BDI28525.1 ribulokinase [Capsulimonas corticalis]
MSQYTIGLDYGTSSVRAVLVDIQSGEELASSVFPYPHGVGGVVIDPRDPDVARQHPRDYLDGAQAVITGVLDQVKGRPGFSANQVIGLGVDTTGSTPIPVDAQGTPLALTPEFDGNLAAMVYLWKDHTGHAEAAQITKTASEIRPQYLLKCGGIYSAEWFWSKILRCLHANPEVFNAAYTWVEHADWLPAVLTGTAHPDKIQRGICAAGHKAMFHPSWGGYPDAEFLTALDPKLARVGASLPNVAYAAGQVAGTLSLEWAERTGLSEGIAVSVGAFDAHLGGVGSGIKPGALVKNIGTSTCDMMIAPLDQELADIPGLCGIVPESILPGYYGLEAGQSAVGDIFNWFVNGIQPGGLGHEELTAIAEKLAPGESGLLALDWHNGNRTILVDQRLTGAVLGLTLQTTPAELYRAWIEATAFGARVIMERLEEYGQKVEQIINCGGISVKNPMVMQIYADIMGRPIAISRSTQTAALGSAVAAAVAAGAFPGFAEATEKMTALNPRIFEPNLESQKTYDRIYAQYKKIHDAFGVQGSQGDLFGVMKELLSIRDEVRNV